MATHYHIPFRKELATARGEQSRYIFCVNGKPKAGRFIHKELDVVSGNLAMHVEVAPSKLQSQGISYWDLNSPPAGWIVPVPE